MGADSDCAEGENDAEQEGEKALFEVFNITSKTTPPLLIHELSLTWRIGARCAIIDQEMDARLGCATAQHRRPQQVRSQQFPYRAAAQVSRWALGALKRVCAEDESDVTLSLKVATFCF